MLDEMVVSYGPKYLTIVNFSILRILHEILNFNILVSALLGCSLSCFTCVCLTRNMLGIVCRSILDGLALDY